jgi:hypothetical protein
MLFVFNRKSTYQMSMTGNQTPVFFNPDIPKPDDKEPSPKNEKKEPTM